MIGDITGLRTRENVENDVADLNKFAEDGYLVRVTLYLSRFMIRRLVAEGRLKQIAITPDCIRYSVAELEKLASGAE